MQKTLVLVYGLVCYCLFLLTFLYLIGFVGGFAVPHSIDSPTQLSLIPALVINALLVGLFGLQHSVMARPGFKRYLTRLIPAPVERSTYVLISSLVLVLLFIAWQGLPQTIWSVNTPWLTGVIWALFAAGWFVVLLSTFLISHFDLFGLRQVYLHWRDIPYTSPSFRQVLFYRWVRHPLMLGFLIAFWATPHMTLGHLEFAVLMTLYILIGVHLAEQDLQAHHGDNYKRYQQEVSMLCPLPRRVKGRQ